MLYKIFLAGLTHNMKSDPHSSAAGITKYTRGATLFLSGEKIGSTMSLAFIFITIDRVSAGSGPVVFRHDLPHFSKHAIQI